MKKRLITSALPYVNNIPHLGNLIQVLSADVFARFCRLRGYNTLYVCGTDEYGTATETRAREEGITPQQLCTRYFRIHDDIYRWFNISFDKFGRTSTPEHTEITQGIFLKLHENGYIVSRKIEQLYSEESDMFLADRYVRGTCPHCGYEEARGDQCEHCGKLLDPSELIEPRSILDNSRPVLRETEHLYIDLPAILPKLQEWLQSASEKGRWARNAIQMTQAWIRDGLKERAITRDLKWGIPVPLDGFRNKVFYVWFDAPIGYISITATLTEKWEEWWKNPEEVELFQFIGKDNIPFHTVIFPSSLLGTGQNWTLLHHMSSSEYLNYEGGQFSKSRGIGVFGNDVQQTGIPADVWRFYMFYNRPETSDFSFTWKDFQEKTNGELIGNLGNLVNRTLTFCTRYFDGVVTAPDRTDSFFDEVRAAEQEITAMLEGARIRDAFRRIFALASYGNKVFQEAEPWKTRTDSPDATQKLLSKLVYLVRDMAILISPYLPATADRIAGFLGMPRMSWEILGDFSGISSVMRPDILFAQLDDETIETLRTRFSGSQSERAERDGKARESETSSQDEPDLQTRFAQSVDLRAVKVAEVARHPNADKLYVLQLDCGTETRQIVTGLVGHYTEEQLQDRTIILVSNLKTAKLRGEKSHGMLLAASGKDAGDNEIVDVLFLDGVEPGTPVRLKDAPPDPDEFPVISIDEFFAMPIKATGCVVGVGSTPLICGGAEVRSRIVCDGSVG
jgi:methionyl-tRNA synthetase